MLRPFPLWMIALVAFVLIGSPPPALAQSANDLRKENQRLQTRVRDLERELDAARQRIAQLEREVEDLTRQLAAGRRPGRRAATPPPPEAVTIDESIPDASPRALLNTLKASYDGEMKEREIGTAGSGGASPDRSRIAYLRALEKWAQRVNRELKSQIEWHVRIGQWTDPNRLEMQAVDPKTHVALGDQFPVTMSAAVTRRLEQHEQRGQHDVFILKGVLFPQVTANPRRGERGPFDKPRFIGPFAEFALIVQATSVNPP